MRTLFALALLLSACGAAPAATPFVPGPDIVVGVTLAPAGGATPISLPTLGPTSSAPTFTAAPAATSRPTTSPVPTATRPPTATPTTAVIPAAQVGDIAQKSGMWAVVTRVDNPGKVGNQFVTVAAGQKLVIVDVIVGNDSDTPMPVNSLNATLIDAEGFAAKVKLAGADRQIDSITLAKGERVQGEIAFEVPSASRPALLRMTTSIVGGVTLEMGLATPPIPPRINPLPRTRPAYAKVGATVDTAGYTLSVVAFEPIAKPSIIYAAKPGYKLVAVEIVVGNNKDDKMSVNPLYAHLVDTRGFLWAVKLGGRDGKQMDSGDIGKGEKVRGWVAFEIPTDATPDAIQYGFGNLFSPTKVYSAVQ
jgi:hypothetical protein